MKERKIPIRTCVVTREKFPKQELIRVVKTKEGNFLVDLTGKVNGRGVYLKKSLEVFNKAKEKNMLARSFDGEFDIEIYDELIKLID